MMGLVVVVVVMRESRVASSELRLATRAPPWAGVKQNRNLRSKRLKKTSKSWNSPTTVDVVALPGITDHHPPTTVLMMLAEPSL